MYSVCKSDLYPRHMTNKQSSTRRVMLTRIREMSLVVVYSLAKGYLGSFFYLSLKCIYCTLYYKKYE